MGTLLTCTYHYWDIPHCFCQNLCKSGQRVYKVTDKQSKKKTLTLSNYCSVAVYRRGSHNWLFFWLALVWFSLFCCPVEHRPFSNPKRGQEHVLTYLCPFAIHHQMITKWYRSPWRQLRSPRSFHRVTIDLSCYIELSLSPVHVLPKFIEHLLPCFFSNFTT